MEIRTVGVVGAGVMGRGVAQNLADTGHEVVLVDLSEGILQRALDEIRRNQRLSRMLGSGGPASGGAAERIRPTTVLADLAAADFVIENVVEDWGVKAALYPELDAACRQGVTFAANTSVIPVTRIASATGRPDRVLGIHFMNPVPLKSTVEVIRGVHTSDECLASATALLEAMGKDAVVVRDGPGFVSNRVLMPAVNEAAFVLWEGVASAEQVDEVFRSCMGHTMGPLETADLIGLDTVLRSIESLQDSFGDSKYRPCPLLRQMVEAGYLGRKSGRGFYDYAP